MTNSLLQREKMSSNHLDHWTFTLGMKLGRELSARRMHGHHHVQKLVFTDADWANGARAG